MKDYADRWFEFIDEYNKESSVPLSYVLLPKSEGGQRPKAAERRKE